MKYLLLSPVCLLFLCLSTDAQHKVVTMADLSRKTLQFNKPGALAIPGLFSHFKVIDERPDTARIGIFLMLGKFQWAHDCQFIFGKPAATEIAGYLNQYSTRTDAPYTALVVLRGLWLSNADYRPEGLKAAEKQYEQFHICLKAEVYATRDSQYIPIFRYDTVWTMKTTDYYASLHPSYSDIEATLSDIFLDLADSASWVIKQKQNPGRLISREQIREFNCSRFDKFADTNTAYPRGVYASLEEFRNNTPSIRDFEIRKEKNQRLLYIKDASGAPNISHDAWGCSDGTTLFIMRDGTLWPVWKEGKAFYFYAFSDKALYAPGYIEALTNPQIYEPHEGEGKEKCIYTLDTDTGEIY
jgi:hypothetical protein